MATYRWTVDTDDFRLRGMILPGGKLEARESKKALRAAYASFAAELARQLPRGPKATARLEVSCNGRPTLTLATYSGRVTETRKGRDGYCLVPARGEWMLEVDDASLEGVSRDRIAAQ